MDPNYKTTESMADQGPTPAVLLKVNDAKLKDIKEKHSIPLIIYLF